MRFLLLLFVAYSSSALARVDRFIGKESVSPRVSHLGHRHYSHVLCRFLTMDDAKAMSSAYTYTYGNPIKEYDPIGLWPMEQEVLESESASAVQSHAISSSTVNKDAAMPVVAPSDSDSEHASGHIDPGAYKEVNNIVLYRAKITGTNDFVSITYNVPPKYVTEGYELQFNHGTIKTSNISQLGIHNELSGLFDLFGSNEGEIKSVDNRARDIDRESSCSVGPCPTAQETSNNIKRRVAERDVERNAAYERKKQESIDALEAERISRAESQQVEINQRIDEIREKTREDILEKRRMIMDRRHTQELRYNSILENYENLLNE